MGGAGPLSFQRMLLAQNPLRRIREEHGLSRAEFARRLGLDYQTLARVEQGYVQDLPPAVVAALARAGVDAGQLAAEYRCWRQSLHRPLVEVRRC